MNSKERSPVTRASHCSQDTLALIQFQALLHAVRGLTEATGQISVGPHIRENYQNFRPIKLPSPKIAIGGAVANSRNRSSERSGHPTSRQTTHRGATASSSSWLGKSSPTHHSLYLSRRFIRSAQSFPEPTRGFTGVSIGTRYRVIVNSTE